MLVAAPVGARPPRAPARRSRSSWSCSRVSRSTRRPRWSCGARRRDRSASCVLARPADSRASCAQGAAYGDEQRFPLKVPPGAVPRRRCPLAVAARRRRVAAGPLLLADGESCSGRRRRSWSAAPVAASRCALAAPALAPLGGARARRVRGRRPDDPRRPGAVPPRAHRSGSGRPTRGAGHPAEAARPAARRRVRVGRAAARRRRRPHAPRHAAGASASGRPPRASFARSRPRRAAASAPAPGGITVRAAERRAAERRVRPRCRRRAARRRRRARPPGPARPAAAASSQTTRSPRQRPANGSPCARDLHRAPARRRVDGVAGERRGSRHRQLVAQQVARASERDRARGARRRRPRSGARRRHPEPAALPDVKRATPSCVPTTGAVVSTIAPGARGTRAVEERVRAAAGDEADVHALGLRRGAQPEARRVRAHLGLRELADREQRRARARAGRACRARTTGPSRASAPRAQLRDRPSRRDRCGAWWPVASASNPSASAALEQPAELDRAVALDARVRRAAGGVARRRTARRRGRRTSSVKLKT